MILQVCICLFILTVLLWCVQTGDSRSAVEVLDGLLDADQSQPLPHPSHATRLRWKYLSNGLPGIIAVTILLFLRVSVGTMVLGFVVVQAAFYLFRRARERARERDEREALERMVPVVMERIVMAALAGLDITSGIQAIIELHDDQDSSREVDPVTRLLMQVMQRAEHGAGFAHALQSVAATVPSVAVRHAFIHLAVAHQEGGEVVQPLRELSDASQVFYQENLEEYISRLPVQATLPLLCTFSGLLLFFLTTPLIQVMELLQSIELPG